MGKKHVSVGCVSAVMLKDPKNFREAMRDPRAEKWKQAIGEEIETLEQNGTWKVVKKPENAKLLHTNSVSFTNLFVGCRCPVESSMISLFAQLNGVFKLKTHADGTIERYKARSVARGDEQECGVDYTYTFSAVLDMESGKIILVVSRIWKVPARHGDVPSAYVKAKKEAELVIMLVIPTGMEFTEEQLRALGVKSKLWNQLLQSILLSLGSRQCYSDSCLYVKIEEDDMTLVGVYVDDILVTTTSVEKVDKFFQDMQVVDLKDLGVVSKFLGVAFSYDEEDGWALDQEQVIQDMLVKFGLGKAAPVSTPIGGEQDGEAPGE
ncbi:hypothetical protein PF004_g4823 [Phytophthora fragariae]|uniref:Reverse transcriptase Ty1/copia-type domain-containing protein n=2 Tax=Phytophthora fragariae TaxID=53985 RepID=A0A6G0PHL2_9STRA|nr:hypothetical protein PF004_g4823 [Phytophthora fragariae]